MTGNVERHIVEIVRDKKKTLLIPAGGNEVNAAVNSENR